MYTLMNSVFAFTAMCLLITSKAVHKERAWNKPYTDYTDEPSTTAYTTTTTTTTSASTSYGGSKPPDYSTKKENCYPGIIKGWFGKLSKIPDGYQLCDGTNGTPNLQDVFPNNIPVLFSPDLLILSSLQSFPKKMKSSLSFAAICLLSLSGAGATTEYGGQKPSYYDQKKPFCHVGTIHGWFGKLSKIPDGYQLCDGTNGTPNLQDVFPMGAGSVFPFGTTGGASSIHLSENQLPAHYHEAGTLSAMLAGRHTHTYATEVSSSGAHVHEVSDFTVSLAQLAAAASIHLSEDQLPAHYHDAGTLSAMLAGRHTHTFATEVSSSGAHVHEVSNFTVSTEPAHVHNFNTKTDEAGGHAHHFGAYFEEDYDTAKGDENFDVPLDKIDTAKSYTVDTSKDGKHKHKILGDTDDAGSHTHTVTGTVGGDGLHTHSVSGETEYQGGHHHAVSGETGYTGAGDAIDIINPFAAIYYICCVEQSYGGDAGYGQGADLSYTDA
eukprot:CAMPEP_0202725894 /NCGR_PEP_ID=MMETSP1385-20130828/184331_1 /ASSEMBLY_ACC=CAM_ASM_000861 /TAXON_ID=933848 /ORGANISM="Elphidium margaritaceum" /LENGTH=492 /DNA_ID=CAMNT_0049392099 /DNA_START=42 /DNA_END=1520 /DNA_ORIENTATION=-